MSSNHAAWYQEGFSARNNGKSMRDNPYQKNSWAYKEWVEGYLDCKQAQYIIAYSN